MRPPIQSRVRRNLEEYSNFSYRVTGYLATADLKENFRRMKTRGRLALGWEAIDRRKPSSASGTAEFETLKATRQLGFQKEGRML